MPSCEYILPAVRAFQAGRPFYVAMCPLAVLPSLFPDDMEALGAELGTACILNEQRVSDLVRYLDKNKTSYVLSALTASVDSEVAFDVFTGRDTPACAGELHIPMSARLILHDGVHRCTALRNALKKNPDLRHDSIPIVLFVDPAFSRSDRIFSDLKRHEHKTPTSLRVFHDYQDEIAQLTREMIPQVCVFASTTEMARSAISNRSRKLFTLSALYHANRTLLADKKDNPYEANVQIAVSFWSHIASVIPDWGNAARGEIAPAELRRSCVHAHAIALAALSRVGRAVLERNEKSWQTKLARLKSFDWSRSNIGLWEGRAMIGGRLSKSTSSVILTGNAIKLHLGLPLSPEEQQLEAHYARNK